MTDLASSRQKIQVEETQYKATVSETTFQKMGGAINHILDNSVNGIGDIIISHLSVASFQSRRGNNWVLMSGQSIIGSDLSLEEGINTLPNMVGNEAFSGQATNDAAVGSYEASQNKAHVHTTAINETGGNNSYNGWLRGQGEASPTTYSNSDTGSEGGSVARPNTVRFNHFIKINNDPT